MGIGLRVIDVLLDLFYSLLKRNYDFFRFADVFTREKISSRCTAQGKAGENAVICFNKTATNTPQLISSCDASPTKREMIRLTPDATSIGSSGCESALTFFRIKQMDLSTRLDLRCRHCMPISAANVDRLTSIWPCR